MSIYRCVESQLISGIVWFFCLLLAACANDGGLGSTQVRPVRTTERQGDARLPIRRSENLNTALGTGGAYDGTSRFGNDLLGYVGAPLRPGEQNWPLDVKSSGSKRVSWITGGRSLELGNSLKCSYRSPVKGELPRSLNVWFGTRPSLAQLSQSEIKTLAFRELLQDVALTKCPTTWGAIVSEIWGDDAWKRLEARDHQLTADQKSRALAQEESNRAAIRAEMDAKEKKDALSKNLSAAKSSGKFAGRLPSDDDIRDAVVQALVDGWRFSREGADVLLAEIDDDMALARFKVVITKSECDLKEGEYSCVYHQKLVRMPYRHPPLYYLHLRPDLEAKRRAYFEVFGSSETLGSTFRWKAGQLVSEELSAKFRKNRSNMEAVIESRVESYNKCIVDNRGKLYGKEDCSKVW